MNQLYLPTGRAEFNQTTCGFHTAFQCLESPEKRFGATLPLLMLCKMAGCFYKFLTTTVAFSFLEHASLTFLKRNFELRAGRNKPCLCASLTACCQPTSSLKAVQQHSKYIYKWSFLEIKHLAKKPVDTFLPRSKQESCFAKLLRVAGLVLFK